MGQNKDSPTCKNKEKQVEKPNVVDEPLKEDLRCQVLENSWM